ncbi:CsbD family protein [Streptomyces sp. BR123]|uniref:CsbD family protein n=1 Tax=Streptomyces sp. BR123 TaxID=2749828 RepID=UPI0015C44ED8|nr:CsbD family protein [Streptomyces sp. BR123]NXY97656.1 CsbD family protein [Streptomyces sp. BR123]
MSDKKKAKAKGEQLKGKAKEAVGRITDDEHMTTEGRAERIKGDVREAEEKTRDTLES